MKRKSTRRRSGQRNLRGGAGWRLYHGDSDSAKPFAASLIKTINMGPRRLAIFSVPKRGGRA
jgi:hypothetical protein